MSKYSKEQLWGLYRALPEELKQAIFSEKTADVIYNSCKKNGIEKDEKISQVAENTGYVLLGLINPQELKEIFLQEIKLKKDVAEKIYQDINSFVFFPLKEILEKLYKIKIESKKNTSPEKNVRKKPARKDIYKEPV